MSLANRKDAIEIIAIVIARTYGDCKVTKTDRMVASHILNKLLRAGYLSGQVTINIDEVQEELEKAAFKCKVEE